MTLRTVTPEPPPTLQFRSALKYPSGFELNLEFESSKRVTAICGPSGSGKTTILSIVAGFLGPDQGRVQLGDRTLLDTESKIDVASEKREIGFVWQDNLLFPHRTVRGNLNYAEKRRVRRTREPQSKRDISFDRVVEVLELKPLLGRHPTTLSGGEARRVALGRALLRGPALLMLDEPVTGLDDALKDRVLEFLERTIDEWQVPTLLVSHDAESVERLADEIVAIENGRLR